MQCQYCLLQLRTRVAATAVQGFGPRPLLLGEKADLGILKPLVKPDIMGEAIVSWQLPCPTIKSGSYTPWLVPVSRQRREEMTAGHVLKFKLEFIRDYCY